MKCEHFFIIIAHMLLYIYDEYRYMPVIFDLTYIDQIRHQMLDV